MKKKKIAKVVYFDDASVADYVQIAKGGELEQTTELLKSQEQNARGKAGGEVGFKLGKVLKIFGGLDTKVSAEAEIGASLNTNKMVKNIVKNTILTDFINILESDKDNGAIKKFDGYKIFAEKDSMAYLAMVSPYLTMLRGGTVEAGDFNIAIDRFDNAMKAGKGYYELIAEKKDTESEDIDTSILRFNIDSFKNNYRIADLIKMDLSIYAIKVGCACKSDLDINNELDLNINNNNKDNPSYEKKEEINEAKSSPEELLDVYDVLLAGVEVNDR